MEIYFESDPIMGVNVTYDFDGQRIYDYFSNLYKFKVWASFEFPCADLIEITDSNYEQLVEQGSI